MGARIGRRLVRRRLHVLDLQQQALRFPHLVTGFARALQVLARAIEPGRAHQVGCEAIGAFTGDPLL
ncbi:hypothetical protein D3C78_1555200 [compost metagenome]